MRSDAFIRVTCDGDLCIKRKLDSREEVEIQLTSIACGGYDERDVDADLERLGWTKDGDRDICEGCSEEDSHA